MPAASAPQAEGPLVGDVSEIGYERLYVHVFVSFRVQRVHVFAEIRVQVVRYLHCRATNGGILPLKDPLWRRSMSATNAPFMTRKLGSTIETWYREDTEHPLLVQGARRTGKTALIEHVGKELVGPYFMKLDFQTDLATIESIFDGPTDDIERIVARIAEYKRVEVDPHRTLLFFDEVQLSEKALNSLRFFAGSRWRVIASGSLLGVTTKRRRLPFPSGVRQINMHPMDFEEYLWAMGEAAMAQAIREHTLSCKPYVLHERALDLYHRYLIVGGMPLPLSKYIQTGLLDTAVTELAEIDATYTADMTDPDNGISGIAAKRIWDSLPKQLLRASTKKFKYADVVRGGRRERLLEPLEWLEAAGIVTRNDLTKDTQAPLAPFNDENGSFFKIYVSDTGIMCRKFGINPHILLDPTSNGMLSSDFRGALAENFVMQSLKAAGLRTYYWMPEEDASRGEVDFVFQNDHAEVIPIEVKSARNVRARSLKMLMDKGHSPYAIRLSEQNFARTSGAETQPDMLSLPLYAAFAIEQLAK